MVNNKEAVPKVIAFGTISFIMEDINGTMVTRG